MKNFWVSGGGCDALSPQRQKGPGSNSPNLSLPLPHPLGFPCACLPFHLTSPHLTSPHLTSPRLASPRLFYSSAALDCHGDGDFDHGGDDGVTPVVVT